MRRTLGIGPGRGTGIAVLVSALLLSACGGGIHYEYTEETAFDLGAQVCADFDAGKLTEIVPALGEYSLEAVDTDREEVLLIGDVSTFLVLDCPDHERFDRFEAEVREAYPQHANYAAEQIQANIDMRIENAFQQQWLAMGYGELGYSICKAYDEFYPHEHVVTSMSLDIAYDPSLSQGNIFDNLYLIGLATHMQCDWWEDDFWDQAAWAVLDRSSTETLYANVYATVDSWMQYAQQNWMDVEFGLWMAQGAWNDYINGNGESIPKPPTTTAPPTTTTAAQPTTTTAARPTTTTAPQPATAEDSLSYPIPGSVYISLCDMFEDLLLFEMVPEIQGWSWESPISTVEALGLIGEAVGGWCPEMMDAYNSELETQYPEFAEEVWFWIAAGA